LSRPYTLFIFGAGSSVQFTSTDSKIKNIKSPINSNFFSTCLSLLRKVNYTSSFSELKNLFSYMSNSRGIKYDDNFSFLEDLVFTDMEDVITDLDIKTSMFENENEYTYLTDILKELIAYTFGKLLGPNIPKKYTDLVKLFQPNDLILIFNYDLILERAMDKNGSFNKKSYLIHPFKIQQKKTWIESNEPYDLELYKLHGSINWVKCIECDSILILDEVIFRSNTFNCNYLNSIICPRCNIKGTLKRLIIPPVQSKKYNEYPFRYLWRRAARKMNNISRIASLGYSLPNTDYYTRSLLRLLYKYNRDLSNIQLITMNQTSKAEGQYLKLFPEITDIKHETSIEEFITTFINW